jgi:hypothetical protein
VRQIQESECPANPGATSSARDDETLGVQVAVISAPKVRSPLRAAVPLTCEQKTLISPSDIRKHGPEIPENDQDGYPYE